MGALLSVLFLCSFGFASPAAFTSIVKIAGNQNDDIEARIVVSSDNQNVSLKVLDSYDNPSKKKQFDSVTQTTELNVPQLQYLSNLREVVFAKENGSKIKCIDSSGSQTGDCQIQIKKVKSGLNQWSALITLTIKEPR